jgi:hypothetical protein
VAGVAGALVLTGDDGSRVRTGDPSTTTTPDRDADRPTPSAPAPPRSSTTVPGSTTTTPPPAGTAPTGPIVAREGILGSWSGSAWVRWDVGAAAPGGDEYQIVRLGDPITTAVGRASTVTCSVQSEPGVDVGLGFTGRPLDPAPIAVTGVADPRPRPVAVLGTADPAYREAAVDVLAGLGITGADPTISQVVRADLDGDGADEVVVVAERLADPEGLVAQEGDYSVAFVRRVEGGDVRSTVIASSVAEGGPFVEVFRVGAFADLNGDGRMEIVLDGLYYEGSAVTVHELRADGTVPEVLSAGCGV